MEPFDEPVVGVAGDGVLVVGAGVVGVVVGVLVVAWGPLDVLPVGVVCPYACPLPLPWLSLGELVPSDPPPALLLPLWPCWLVVPLLVAPDVG